MVSSLDMVRGCLSVLTGLIPGLRLGSSITGKHHLEFTAATELANAITREGKIPYRDAYRMVGQAVGLAVKENRRLKELGADENRSEEHTSELQSRSDLVCRLLLE